MNATIDQMGRQVKMMFSAPVNTIQVILMLVLVLFFDQNIENKQNKHMSVFLNARTLFRQVFSTSAACN